jgi:hypothetical protein
MVHFDKHNASPLTLRKEKRQNNGIPYPQSQSLKNMLLQWPPFRGCLNQLFQWCSPVELCDFFVKYVKH